jgi:hypothetical protein
MTKKSELTNNNEDVKKPYKQPKLEVIGSLEKITKGPGNGSIDSLFGGQGGFLS